MININFTIIKALVHGLFTSHLNLINITKKAGKPTSFSFTVILEYDESDKPCQDNHKNRIHLQLVTCKERCNEDDYTWYVHENIAHQRERCCRDKSDGTQSDEFHHALYVDSILIFHKKPCNDVDNDNRRQDDP